MLEAGFMVTVLVTFLVAGMVKGVIGLGLPTVSLALLTVTTDLPTAMVLLIAPSLVTNFVQAVSGGHARAIVVRIWPFLLCAGATVWVGSLALRLVDLGILTALLGFMLILYSGLNFAGVRFRIPSNREKGAGILAGVSNGILTGMTGSFVVPGVMYLQAIGLPRDMLVQAMGLLFTISTLGLGAALFDTPYLTGRLVLVSAFAVIPALIGMWIGQRLRHQLSEQAFRRYFFVSLFLLGVYILWRILIKAP